MSDDVEWSCLVAAAVVGHAMLSWEVRYWNVAGVASDEEAMRAAKGMRERILQAGKKGG